jgi:hypothetical protein
MTHQTVTRSRISMQLQLLGWRGRGAGFGYSRTGTKRGIRDGVSFRIVLERVEGDTEKRERYESLRFWYRGLIDASLWLEFEIK